MSVSRIARILLPYWGRMTLVVLATIAGSALTAVNPLVTGLIIDRAFAGRDEALLVMLALALVATEALFWLVTLIRNYLSTIISQQVMRDLRLGIYERLQRVALRFFTTERTGEIISRLINDVNGVEGVVTNTLSTTFMNVATAVITFVIMLRLNVPLTLIVLCLVPCFLVISTRTGSVSHAAHARTQAALADLTAHLEESLNVSGALLTKIFGRQQATTRHFSRTNEALLAAQLRQQMIGHIWSAIIHIFFALVPALVYYVGGRQVIGGTLSLGDLIAFSMLQYRLFSPLGGLLSLNVDLQGALALFERIFAYQDLPVEIADRPEAIALDQIRGHVRFRHVGFSYLPPRPTLVDIDFDVQPGQLVALVGPSGAGKTTITYLLARLYEVEQGAVEIDNHDVRDVTLESLTRQIGVVTQDPYLLNGTVRENIAYARPDTPAAQIVAAAQAASIHERIMALPDGYDTLIGARGYTLSGGEKQRLAIARAILTDPRIVILDEATSALDTRAEQLVQAALSRLLIGRTTIVIAHRLSTILAADQILIIDAGRIVERGTHAELLRVEGLYARLYEQQFAASVGQQGQMSSR